MIQFLLDLLFGMGAFSFCALIVILVVWLKEIFK